MRITASMHFSKAVDFLKSKGVEIADLTADEIFALCEACRREADPFREVNADAAGIPVRVCPGVYFWKLTIGASIWLDQCAEPELGANTPEYRLALVYALIHSREAEAFEGLYDRRSILMAVKDTMRGVTATPAEVNLALDIALGIAVDNRARDNAETAADFAAICARLESQTGVPAAEWIWGRSAAYSLLAYNDLHDFAAAYAGAKPNHLMDELDRACNRRRKILADIILRVKGAPDHG